MQIADTNINFENLKGALNPNSLNPNTEVLHILQPFNLNGGLSAGGTGVSPKSLAIWGIYYQNNPFLGMFQIKFSAINLFKY